MTAFTKKQAQWLLDHAHEVKAVSVGIGSNGYPPGDDGWVLLTSGKSVWLTPEGEARPS